MSHDKDKLLLSEFKKALKKNASAPYSNLDDNFMQKFGFFAGRYEEIMKETGTHIPPHKWSYHRIGLLKKGEALYTCGIYRFTAKKNTLLLLPARVIITNDWTPDGCGYTVLFNIDFLLQNNLSYRAIENKGILQSSIKPYLSLTEKQASEVEAIFNTILKEKEVDSPFQNELIALKIVELLILCERYYSEVHDIKHNYETLDLLRTFTDLIEKYFSAERSVTFYASHLHVHPNYLNAVIKSKTGITAKESIQNRIVLEAKYLLHTTNLSVKEISTRIGFEDPNYFTTFFKKLEKTSPAAYRSSFI
jgi:AraC-like DNA-binding protein